MLHWRLTALAALIGLLCSASAFARTWRVEKYGPADFQAIQPALDAAAPGDTVLIGAGRWMEKQNVILPGWSWPVDVYAWVHDSDLTLLGIGPSSTIIGPLAANFQDFGPEGIVALNDVGAVTVKNLSVVNVYGGVYGDAGPVLVEGCRFDGTGNGVFYAGSRGLTVDNCEFWNSVDGNGVWCNYAGPSAIVEDSRFTNVSIGVAMGRTRATVQRCTFQGGDGGIQFENGSTGEILDCSIRDAESVAVAVFIGSTVRMERTFIEGGACNVLLVTNATITGVDNELLGGSWSTLSIDHAAMDFHGNHIMNGGGYSVHLATFLSAPNVTIDLTNNYWGTDDAAQIAQWIYDFHDDETVHAVVDFEPFAGGPIPVEQQSWGRVKSLYKR